MRQACLVLVLLGLASPGLAHAQSQESTAESAQPATDFSDRVSGDYFLGGGAIPFVYGSLAVTLGFRFFVSPPNTPRFFPESEGGIEEFSNTVPEVALGGFAFASAGLIGLVPGPARFHHLKGYGQALLTTLAATEMAKNLIGRRRPHFQIGDTNPDYRRSFFSGHASVTAASTIYMGLYFREHLASRLTSAAGPVATMAVYAALASVLVGVPVSRLVDNKHHLSDVLTGGFVGAAMAVGFFAYQESRFREAREEFYQAKRNEKRSRIIVVPDIENRGFTLMTTW